MLTKPYIGTSGWMYDHWEGVFYPSGLSKNKWLEYYTKYFDTVEINNTFYHLPQAKTFKKWEASVPKTFIFAIKANRFITHIKRLHQAKDSVRLFLNRAKLLKKHLGPILYQLPPHWNANPDRLREFVKVLPKGYFNAFEFRDPSWFNQEIYQILRSNRLSFCIYNMPGIACPHEVTGPFVYIRMHGGNILYGSNYSEKELRKLATEVKTFLQKNFPVYIYFNNDAYGYAVKNALRLKELLSN